MKPSHCFIRFCCVVLLAITGCSPAAQSRYAPERNFTDPKALALALAAEQGDAEEVRPVSYTHLTLPTICSV